MTTIPRYFDSRFSRNAAKIVQGQYVIVPREEFIVTTLGSCVAACIRDRFRGVGGMNHFMLPDAPNGSVASSAARYGVHAMELLINELLKRGSRRSDLEAKVFGAASLIGSDPMRVGERNADFVQAFLAHENIPVMGADLRGDVPRKIYFFPDTGHVLVRYLRIFKNSTIKIRDAVYYESLRRIVIHGNADLF